MNRPNKPTHGTDRKQRRNRYYNDVLIALFELLGRFIGSVLRLSLRDELDERHHALSEPRARLCSTKADTWSPTIMKRVRGSAQSAASTGMAWSSSRPKAATRKKPATGLMLYMLPVLLVKPRVFDVFKSVAVSVPGDGDRVEPILELR